MCSRGRRRHFEFGAFAGEERVFGTLRDEFLELDAGHFYLLFPQGRQRQQNLRKRSQIVAMFGGDFKLLDTCFLVTVDASEAEEKLLGSRQTPDEIIRHAQTKIGIRSVWGNH